MKYKPSVAASPVSIPVVQDNHKLLQVNEKKLIEELDRQLKLGFEVIEILEKQMPNSSSDMTVYKILLRKK